MNGRSKSKKRDSEAGLQSVAPAPPILRWTVACLILLLVTTWFFFHANDLGLTWDEVPYRNTQILMANWFGQLFQARDLSSIERLTSQEVILGDGRFNAAWICNRYGPNFHPPLAGMLSNVTHVWLRGVLGDLGSRRLASGILLALSAMVLCLFMSRRYSIWAGVAAAAALVLMPRVLGHGHIAGTDMPAMALWGFVALAFWNGLESRWWRHLFGVLLGLSFLVKFSAVLVVLPLAIWLLLYRVIPNISARSGAVGVAATIVIALPLAISGYEIIKLSNQIRVQTQERMLGDVASFLEVPFNPTGRLEESELQEQAAALTSRFEAAAANLDARDIQAIRTRLDLSNYIQFVSVRNLGVQSRIPGWFFFLPGMFWLIWSAVVALLRLERWSFPALELWLAGLGLAPMVALALNPTWWHETTPQLAHYYQITVDRQAALPDIEIFYAASKYVYSLPWHNGWVLIAITVPLTLLATALIGIGGAFLGIKRDPLRVFIVFQLIALPVFRMFPTPAHDGIRLMLPTFFFLAALVGYGFHFLATLVYRLKDEEYSITPILLLLQAVIFGPAVFATYKIHPYELSYYNQAVGGLAGAQRFGFEPTYWYDALTPGLLAELNSADGGLPANATLSLPEPRRLVETMTRRPPDWVEDLPPVRINPEVLNDLSRFGELRPDIAVTSPRIGARKQFPYALLLTHSSKASPFTRLLYSMRPKIFRQHDGVRLLSVYPPEAVARTWAVWLILDDSDYSRTPAQPKIHQGAIELIRDDPVAFYAAALQITATGLAETARPGNAGAAPYIDHLLTKRAPLEFLLQRHPDALVEAAELINRTLASHPQRLRAIIESDGYLPDSEAGGFLGE